MRRAPVLALLVVALAGCGGGGAGDRPEAGSPAAGGGRLPRPAGPVGVALSQVPAAALDRGRIAAADLGALRRRARRPAWSGVLGALLTSQDARIVRAVGPTAATIVRAPGLVVVTGTRAAEATTAVGDVEDARTIEAIPGRIVVGRATDELLAGRPAAPLAARPEVAAAQACAGDVAAELLLGPAEPGLGAGSAVLGGVRTGVGGRAEVVVCVVRPTAGVGAAAARLELGLRGLSLRPRGPVVQATTGVAGRGAVRARLAATPAAVALLGDALALRSLAAAT